MTTPIRSLALRHSRRLRPITPFASSSPLRSYHVSAVRLAGKESALHDEARPEKAEHYKQKHLQQQKEGKGKWEDELASDSESIVKADRGEVEASQHTIEKLQKETEKLAGEKHK
ncbi:MAG: hypothetical protein M1821_000239 [Bathelium mastoideum]|nr:MAG: hypothetical protein M1821_000239 [Bathelium mastoideum]